MLIRSASEHDADAIVGIYNHYVLKTAITFEEHAVSAADMAARIQDVLANALPWLVVEESGVIVGYAYASKWRTRHAYRYSVESTVYLAGNQSGKGLGTQLYAALLAQLREKGFHMVIGGIALPNAGSVALHEKCGFQQVALFKEVGFKFERWIDVGYWEVKL